MSQGWPFAGRGRDRRTARRGAPLACARSLGRTEAIDEHRTRLTGTTENLYWYATEIAELPAPYRVVGGPEIRDAVRRVAERMLESLA